MAKVSVSLNGRAFTIGCEEGQQAYLRELSAHVDGHVRELADKVGQIGDLRLLLMASLIVADEMRELQGEVEALRDENTELKGKIAGVEARRRADRADFAERLNAAAGRLEAAAANGADA